MHTAMTTGVGRFFIATGGTIQDDSKEQGSDRYCEHRLEAFSRHPFTLPRASGFLPSCPPPLASLPSTAASRSGGRAAEDWGGCRMAVVAVGEE
jgi:hypothetical protein